MKTGKLFHWNHCKCHRLLNLGTFSNTTEFIAVVVKLLASWEDYCVRGKGWICSGSVNTGWNEQSIKMWSETFIFHVLKVLQLDSPPIERLHFFILHLLESVTAWAVHMKFYNPIFFRNTWTLLVKLWAFTEYSLFKVRHHQISIWSTQRESNEVFVLQYCTLNQLFTWFFLFFETF